MTKQPTPPFPEQHQEKPGIESELDPRPRYQARAYKPSGKLDGKAALITGGDSGIGRAVAVMFAREGADVGIVHLHEEQSDADETAAACSKIRQLSVAELLAETVRRISDAESVSSLYVD
jgi:hypothetical protein